MMLVLLTAAGCDGSGWSRTVPARAFPSGRVYELQIGARLNQGIYASVGDSVFSSEEPLAELIRRGAGETKFIRAVSGELLGALLTEAREDGTQDFYYLSYELRKDDVQWYRFSGLRFRLCGDGDEEQADYALVPAFCLDRIVADWSSRELQYGARYHCSAVTVEQTEYPQPQALFEAFYLATGQYTVEREAEMLTVRPLTDRTNACAFRLEFETVNGEPYVTVLPAENEKIPDRMVRNFFAIGPVSRVLFRQSSI